MDTFHLSTDQARRVNELLATRGTKTPSEVVSQLLNLGLYQVEHRPIQNAKKRDQQKLGRQVQVMVNGGKLSPAATRLLAQELGLAQRDMDDVVSIDDIVEDEVTGELTTIEGEDFTR